MKTNDAIAPMWPAERRTVGIIAVVGMLRILGLFFLLPVLSLYAAGLPGATPVLIGLAVGGYGLTQATLQIPLGALSDRVGRIPVILGGLAVFAAGGVVAALSDTVWGLVAGRLLQGAGAVSATLTALIADATREQVRTRSMAIYGVGIGGSFLVSLIVGPMIAARFGVATMFWIAAALGVTAAALLIVLPGGLRRPTRPQRWSLVPAFRPDLLKLDVYTFLLHMILTANFVALPFLFADVLEIALANHWKVYVGALLLSLFVAIPLIIGDDRHGKASLSTTAIALMLAGELVLAFAGVGVTPVLIALVLFFGGFTFLEASLPSRISILADGDLRGASLGVFSSAQFLGAFAGGVIGGRFLGAGRPADVFLVCAILAALWLAAAGLFRR